LTVPETINRADMTTFFLSTLLLLTIVAAFAFGVAAGYWVICGLLNLFNPRRTHNKPASAPVLAPSSGD
jgi:hypothetical protein